MKKAGLILIIGLALLVRFYRINAPLADWHSWRQADTAAVSRNFIKKGFDWLHPRFDDLSNMASGLENPEGYRFVEFPIYNTFHALLAKYLPFFDLVVWGRLLSIFSSIGSLVFLYLIVRHFLGDKVALLSAFFFAVLPFNVYYSRVILPEPMMLFTSLGMVWLFISWIEREKSPSASLGVKGEKSDKGRKRGVLVMATLFATASWLIKPFTLVLLLPVVYLAWKSWRLTNPKRWALLFFCFLVSLLPFIAWRWWMTNYPEGIPFSPWLFNLSKIRLKGAFFWWLFAERIGKLILGSWGLILFGLGLIIKPQPKEGWFFYSWLVAMLAYFVIVAGGNVQHDYYQVLTVPIICVFLAKGAWFLLAFPKKHFSLITNYLLLITSVLFMLAFSWYQVRDYFNINNLAIVEAGQAADRLLPERAKVIAPYGGDTAFLFHTNRQGWSIGVQIEEFIRQGATHYVNVNFDPEVEWLMAAYCPLEKTDQYVIIELNKNCKS
jgi:4-amino-4-deoxy-L-arabinose transferase-like glycosyltransferase